MHASCTIRDVSSEQKIKKGSVFVLNEPYYFVDYPGTDTLEPVKGYSEYLNPPPAKTLLPVGTKVKYLKTTEYNAFMLPMPDRTAYGRVIGFKGMSHVAIDSLIGRQSSER